MFKNSIVTSKTLQARKKDLEELEAALKDALAAEGSADSSITVDNAIGRLTRMEAIQAQAMGEAGKHRARQRLAQVRRALERIEMGRFGMCVQCGSDIPPWRLEIMPESALCVTCAARR